VPEIVSARMMVAAQAHKASANRNRAVRVRMMFSNVSKVVAYCVRYELTTSNWKDVYEWYPGGSVQGSWAFRPG